MTAKTAIIGQGGEDEAVEAVQYWFEFNHLRLCEQEDGKKTACSGRTQYNTFSNLEDNSQEDGSKTSFLGGTGCEQEQYWFDFNHLGLGEQEDGSKTARSGGTQFNTFPILKDNPQEEGSKTLF